MSYLAALHLFFISFLLLLLLEFKVWPFLRLKYVCKFEKFASGLSALVCMCLCVLSVCVWMRRYFWVMC